MAKDVPDADPNICVFGCAPPLVCTSGKCECPGGRTFCDLDCVDTKADKAHCGSCGRVCGAEELCIEGACVGEVAHDGCGDDPVRNATLQDIAVYQSVKIPVMVAGVEVETSTLKARIVQGRETLVRAFVAVDGTWTPREVSARLTLTSEERKKQVFSSRKQLEVTTKEAELSSSFHFFLPAEALTTSTKYSVELVECGKATGAVGRHRFPASGTADLGVVSAGELKVTIIPIRVGEFMPDTTDAALEVYASQLMAMYPISKVTLRVGDTLTTKAPIDWESMLQDLRNKRATDAPSPDVYYFGLVKPAVTMRSYCLVGCTAGIGYVVNNPSSSAAIRRVAVGLGYADKASAETMAHELGHNHGRGHSPCVAEGGTIVGVDPDFPYSNGGTGVWGYDRRTRTLIDPSTATDIMGYCKNQWISDYTYAALTDRVQLINSQAMVYTPPSSLGRWWLMDIDSKGAHWGMALDYETVAEGEPETALIYGRNGQVLTSVVVYRSMMSNGRGSMVMVPAPDGDWDSVVVHGAPPLSFAAPMRPSPKAR